MKQKMTVELEGDKMRILSKLLDMWDASEKWGYNELERQNEIIHFDIYEQCEEIRKIVEACKLPYRRIGE